MSFFRQRYRLFRAHPWSLATAFAAVVSASALGGALLSVINGLLFARPGVPNANLLVRIATRADETGWRRALTFQDFKAMREAVGDGSLTSVVRTTRYVAADSETDRTSVSTGYVSGDFFEVVGGRAAVGRLLNTLDESQASGVVVLSHDLWVRRFGASSAVLGNSIEVDGRPFQVVGVLDDEFTGPFKGSPTALWANIGAYAADQSVVDASRPEVFGLAPSPPARERLKGLAAITLQQPRGGEARPGTVAVSSLESEAPDLRKRTALPALFFLNGGLVAVGAFNLASCMILITSARYREVAIRLALGAAPGAIARQMLLDAFTISFAAFGLAALLVPGLAQLLAGLVEVPFGVRIRPDIRSYSIMALASLAIAVVASLAALRHIRSKKIKEHLQNDESRAGRLGAGDFLHRSVIGAQVCLSVLFVVVSALWLRAAHQVEGRVEAAGVGFDAAHTLYARSAGAADGWTPDVAAEYWDAAVQQLARLPFVTRTALTEYVFGASREYTTIGSASTTVKGIAVNRTSPEYFEAMGIRLVSGRPYTKSEAFRRSASPSVSSSCPCPQRDSRGLRSSCESRASRSGLCEIFKPPCPVSEAPFSPGLRRLRKPCGIKSG